MSLGNGDIAGSRQACGQRTDIANAWIRYPAGYHGLGVVVGALVHNNDIKIGGITQQNGLHGINNTVASIAGADGNAYFLRCISQD